MTALHVWAQAHLSSLTLLLHRPSPSPATLSCLQRSQRHAFAPAALPAGEALPHLAHWLRFYSVILTKFNHHLSGKPFLKLPETGDSCLCTFW